MFQIIFISCALAFLIASFVLNLCNRLSLSRGFLLGANAFFVAYTIDLVISIDYMFISLVEVAYIILLIFAIISFLFVLVNVIRKRN